MKKPHSDVKSGTCTDARDVVDAATTANATVHKYRQWENLEWTNTQRQKYSTRQSYVAYFSWAYIAVVLRTTIYTVNWKKRHPFIFQTGLNSGKSRPIFISIGSHIRKIFVSHKVVMLPTSPEQCVLFSALSVLLHLKSRLFSKFQCSSHKTNHIKYNSCINGCSEM